MFRKLFITLCHLLKNGKSEDYVVTIDFLAGETLEKKMEICNYSGRYNIFAE